MTHDPVRPTLVSRRAAVESGIPTAGQRAALWTAVACAAVLVAATLVYALLISTW